MVYLYPNECEFLSDGKERNRFIIIAFVIDQSRSPPFPPLCLSLKEGIKVIKLLYKTIIGIIAKHRTRGTGITNSGKLLVSSIRFFQLSPFALRRNFPDIRVN